MIYADLHCDTATVLYDKKTNFKDKKLHLNHNSLKNMEKLVQCFAIFTDDTIKNGGMEYFRNVLAYSLPLIKKEKNIFPVLTIEGGDVIEGDLSNLKELKDCGVRMFGFVWNGETELAVGAETNNKKGLKPLGLQCIGLLEEMDIIPDVSHLSEEGFYDVARFCKKPFIASHSNARKICSNLRNLTDEQIMAIIHCNGLIGINLFPPFIGPNADINGILRHIDYILSMGGEDVLAMGCDFDGIVSLPKGISGEKSILLIEKTLRKEYNDKIADKILCSNAMRTLKISI